MILFSDKRKMSNKGEKYSINKSIDVNEFLRDERMGDVAENWISNIRRRNVSRRIKTINPTDNRRRHWSIKSKSENFSIDKEKKHLNRPLKINLTENISLRRHHQLDHISHWFGRFPHIEIKKMSLDLYSSTMINEDDDQGMIKCV